MKCGAPEGLCHFPRTLGSFRSPLCWVLAKTGVRCHSRFPPHLPLPEWPPLSARVNRLNQFRSGHAANLCWGPSAPNLPAGRPGTAEVHWRGTSDLPSTLSQPATRRLSFCTTYTDLKTLAGDLLSRTLFHTTRGTTPPRQTLHTGTKNSTTQRRTELASTLGAVQPRPLHHPVHLGCTWVAHPGTRPTQKRFTHHSFRSTRLHESEREGKNPWRLPPGSSIFPRPASGSPTRVTLARLFFCCSAAPLLSSSPDGPLLLRPNRLSTSLHVHPPLPSVSSLALLMLFFLKHPDFSCLYSRFRVFGSLPSERFVSHALGNPVPSASSLIPACLLPPDGRTAAHLCSTTTSSHPTGTAGTLF